jgi:hypothetical protein
MAGAWDKLTHKLFGVNAEVVRKNVIEDLPDLESKIRQELAEWPLASHLSVTRFNRKASLCPLEKH